MSDFFSDSPNPARPANGQYIYDQHSETGMQQILLHFSHIHKELEDARRQVDEYKERLDEQSMDMDLLAMDLDHHKETLATVLRDLAEKQGVVQAQGFLLHSAREEVQSLLTANAEKDRMMSDLRAQMEQSTVEDGRKKRKLAP